MTETEKEVADEIRVYSRTKQLEEVSCHETNLFKEVKFYVSGNVQENVST